MSYNLIFRDKAVFEMEDAFDYYESKSKGLGKNFLKTVQKYLDKIEVNPLHFPNKYDGIREAYIKNFPFVILFEIHGNIVVIYSVFHTSRNPIDKI